MRTKIAVALLSLSSIGQVAQARDPIGNGREEVIQLEVFESISSTNPSIGSKISLTNLIQAQGDSLRGKIVMGARVTAGGFGNLNLDSNSGTHASAYLDPMIGNATLDLRADSNPITSGQVSLSVQGEMFIETVELRLKSMTIVVPPPPSGPRVVRLDYGNNINENGSANFTLPPGNVVRIKAVWTDWTEGAKVDFILAGNTIARDVDVNSDGSGRTIDVNRMLTAPTSLQLVIKKDPIFLNYLEVEYSGATLPSNADQRFDINRDVNNGETIGFPLNSGFLNKLRFSWSDNKKNARVRVLINGAQVADLDVSSDGKIKEQNINQSIPAGSYLQLSVYGDRARLNFAEADFR